MIKRISFLFVITAFLFTISGSCVFAKNNAPKEQIRIINNNLRSQTEAIELVDKYQKKYFEIIKRNNMLLQADDTEKFEKDSKELEDLFNEVERQVLDKGSLKKYKKIQKRFSDCSGITTPEINECAEKNYNAVNKLLNKTYKKAEAKASFEDAKKLAQSQINWEKEVENYKKVFDSMNFGTIGTSTFYSYQINMTEFRTLLLMMCL